MNNLNQALFTYNGSPWWLDHRVCHDHNDRVIYVTSLRARLRWRVPFGSPR